LVLLKVPGNRSTGTPEWKETLGVHLDCWDKIIDLQKRRGVTIYYYSRIWRSTLYALLPYTRQPIVDQWEVNVFMMNLLKEKIYGS
jgi:hypothetical protein